MMVLENNCYSFFYISTFQNKRDNCAQCTVYRELQQHGGNVFIHAPSIKTQAVTFGV